MKEYALEENMMRKQVCDRERVAVGREESLQGMLICYPFFSLPLFLRWIVPGEAELLKWFREIPRAIGKC